MPVEFASASFGEPAKEPDFVMIDETGLPTPVIDARERPYEAEFASNSDCCALRTVGIHVFLRTLMRTVEQRSTAAQTLKQKETIANWRLQETIRACEAYRVTDKINDLRNRRQHRIDMTA